MLGEAHDILHEFPELKDKINDLHEHNAEFARLMDEHDKLDTKIRELEELGTPVSDEHMEEFKFKRTRLKDDIYQLLRNLK